MQVQNKTKSRGFTLLELLVAMAVTSFLIVILVAVTGIAIDAWRQSRDDVRGSKLGRTALAVVTRDFQSMVRQTGNTNEWLSARIEPELTGASGLAGPANSEIPNAVQVVFFCAPTDRYDGQVMENPGDVAVVSYRLVYRDQILDRGPEEQNAFPTFALYRNVVNPIEAFNTLYQVPDLLQAYGGGFQNQDLTANNFIVENIYEFTLTFAIEYQETSGGSTVTRTRYFPITIGGGGGGGGNALNEFRVFGDRLFFGGTTPDPALVNGGRIKSVSFSVTVITDEGTTLARRGAINQQQLLDRYSYRYSSAAIVPSP